MCFCIHYGTIVWDNTGTTPNTLYMKTVNKKYAHNYMYAILHMVDWGHKERLKIHPQSMFVFRKAHH